jgi:transposase
MLTLPGNSASMASTVLAFGRSVTGAADRHRTPALREFAWMLQCHQEDLMNYLRVPIHNGTVEGLNNKAKAISRKAYGFRTAKNYIRNLYHCIA